MFEGTGTLRRADQKYPSKAGDFICSPADPGQPHQIINSSDDVSTDIALSTTAGPDILQYPDSDKYGAWHGAMNGSRADTRFVVFGRKKDGVGYWDGEEE